MDSVTALGYGPISAAKLNELEEQGIIESYIQNGKRKFSKVYRGNYSAFAKAKGYK